jgi:hypothetical protein
MCDQTTTNICNQLAAQANELRIAEQREATIAAAMALPEQERYRLWVALSREFAPPVYNVKGLDERTMQERNRRMELLRNKLSDIRHSTSDAYRMEKELEELQRVAAQ